MGKKETEQFTKRVYTASNNPASLLHRNLVQKKNPSQQEAPYCRKLLEILRALKKLSITKDTEKIIEWIKQTIPSLEALIKDTNIEEKGTVFTDLINTIKGK